MIKCSVPFCGAPFNCFQITWDGDVICCCAGEGRLGNLQKSSAAEIWNSPKWRRLRSDVLNGCVKNNPYCRKCQVCLPDKMPPPWLNREPIMPTTVNCGYDPRCNLHCASCRLQHYQPTEKQIEVMEAVHHKMRTQLLPHAKILFCATGGDPFVSPLFRHWLQTLTPQDAPNLKQLMIMTNGELLNEEMWQSMHKAHSLIKGILVSMDAATKTTFEQLRLGGNWEKLQANLKFIATLPKNVALQFVIQRKNHHEMAQFVHLAKSFNRKWYTSFWPIRNWVFPEEVFLREAIHVSSHPEHLLYLRSLQLKEEALARYNRKEMKLL